MYSETRNFTEATGITVKPVKTGIKERQDVALKIVRDILTTEPVTATFNGIPLEKIRTAILPNRGEKATTVQAVNEERMDGTVVLLFV